MLRVKFILNQNHMRKNKATFSFIFVLPAAIAICCAANFARATENTYTNLAITEIMYNPAGKNSEHAKWIELANLSNETITLTPIGSETSSGWKIKDLKIKDSSNHYLYAKENTPIEINPGGFVIISDNLPNFENDHSGFANAVLLKSAVTLTTAESDGYYHLTLYDGDSALDDIFYSKDWYPDTDDKGKSLEEKDPLADNGKENWQESCEAGGTPGSRPQTCEVEQDPPPSDTPDLPKPGTPPDEEPNECAMSSSAVKLNEIFPWSTNGNEFVEIKNADAGCVNVSGWKIMDAAGHKKEFPSDSTVNPGEYLILEGNLHLNNDSDTVYLLDKDSSAKTDALDSRLYEKAKKDLSFSLAGGVWSWTSTPTPDEKNVITDPPDDNGGTPPVPPPEDKYVLSDKVYLNELFPNPKNKTDDEYIEIANSDGKPIDLYKWTLRDASKTGKYVFKEHTTVESGGYFVIHESQSKIALNNSNESVHLYDPQNDLVSSVSYEKSQKGASYNFDGANWRWSKYPTPGARNKSDSEPVVKIKKIKRAWKGIPVEFSAVAKDKESKKLKYSWDFGDGKKSSLKKTSHRYLDTGKYLVKLTVRDDSQTVEKSFTLTVKNSPRPDIEIVRIVPNPAGKDADGETIGLKNNSGKYVSLDGWKIATGSGEKMYNHPIGDELIINSGETKVITREMSKFSLNNKAGKVNLVSPDGKTIDVVEYEKEKISEDEAYAKIDGEWQWIAADSFTETDLESSPDEEDQFIDDPTGEKQAAENDEEDAGDDVGEVLGASEEKATGEGPAKASYTSEDEFIFYKALGLTDLPSETNSCFESNFPFSIAYLPAATL